MGFNLAFKGLISSTFSVIILLPVQISPKHHTYRDLCSSGALRSVEW